MRVRVYLEDTDAGEIVYHTSRFMATERAYNPSLLIEDAAADRADEPVQQLMR